ncbi:hypothetical protein [Variovorax saccharolyticus]|uniref:hypothetical protein n=1 Tax=Variovorax saccharolyticus TaxID=3053516 RepID=UPI0025764D5E|nr:hypothetical protein [Variovorax sp. J31P216]MDM0026990.1 hypothetical protein [Variovorax sp. J31P216]
MHASVKILALGLFATLGAFASMTASAQSDGADYRPMQTSNTAPNPDVNAGAMAAARPTGTESIGQSTAAPMVSQLTREEVYKGAVEAAHPLNTESIGQSTGMAGITSGTPR